MTDRQLVALAALTKVLDEWEDIAALAVSSAYGSGVLDVIDAIRDALNLSEPDKPQPEQEP